jgi:hypothetical protein
MFSILSFRLNRYIMKHILSLNIPDTMNDWSISIYDTSIYTDIIPVSCPTLQILLPGFKKATTLTEDSVPELIPGFSRHFTACNLEVQTKNCGSVYDCLPDGIYVIKYSISPHDYVFVEYNHLRITQALKKWKEKMCELNLNACAPDKDKTIRLRELMDIKGYLEAAKAEVEFCHHADKGMELYNYTIKRLDKLNCTNC